MSEPSTSTQGRSSACDSRQPQQSRMGTAMLTAMTASACGRHCGEGGRACALRRSRPYVLGALAEGAAPTPELSACLGAACDAVKRKHVHHSPRGS
jgi:hypothetical protein